MQFSTDSTSLCVSQSQGYDHEHTAGQQVQLPADMNDADVSEKKKCAFLQMKQLPELQSLVFEGMVQNMFSSRDCDEKININLLMPVAVGNNKTEPK